MIVATVNPEADLAVAIALDVKGDAVSLGIWRPDKFALARLGWEDALALKGALDEAMRELERQDGGTG